VRPPLWQRATAWLLGVRVSAIRQDEIIGDLAEDVSLRRQTHGRLAAAAWLVREVLSLHRAYAATARVDRPRRAWMDSLRQDARYAVRGYLRTPLFTIATLLILTLGLGATGAMVGVVRAVILRPLPYPEPNRLVRIFETRPSKQSAVSPPNYFDVSEHARAFSGLAAFWSPNITTTDAQGNPQKVLAATCSHNLFTVLGVKTELGRGFVAADDVPGARRTVVLGHGLWQRLFGGDPGIVGRQVLLDNTPTEVVGVMPAGFDFPVANTELWVPLGLSHTKPPNPAIPTGRYRGYRILSVVGRLRPGVSLTQADADLAGVSRALEQQFPDVNRQMTARAIPLHDVLVGSVRPALLVLLGAVVCVLLIACANVGSLFVARGLGRAHEMSIRVALGAERQRLVRQLLTESLLLSLAGGAAGVVLASWAFDWLLGLAPAESMRQVHGGIDAATIVFTMATAVFAGLVFGVAPLVQRTGQFQDALRGAGRGAVSGGRRRGRQLVVIVEVALSLILLIGAGLLIQSLIRMEQVDVGFRGSNVLTVDRIELPRGLASPETSAAFFEQLLTKVRAIPGTVSVGLTLGLPLDPKAHFFVDESSFSIEGEPALRAADRPSAPLHVVSADYFATIGVPLVRGRWFDARDRENAPGVMLINEAMARKFFPNENAIGRRITHDLSIVPGQPVSREIVGVIGDVRHFGLEQPTEPQMFVPHLQMPWPSMAMVLRTGLDGARVDGAVREAVWSLDRSIPVPPALPLDHLVTDALGQPQFRAGLLGAFAVAALWLAMVGLYGTMACTVQMRTREIGLRMALGATPDQASRLLLRSGLTLALTGIAIGLAGAFALTRVLSALLFGVESNDLATFVAVPVLLMTLAWCACYLPARRVYRIDPIAAINGD
jgi:putative ABC transport system permease protein